MKPEFQRGPARARRHLRAVDRAGQPAQQVPLSALARRRSSRPRRSSINHIGQFPAATISFNLAPGASLGDAVDGDRGGAAARSACRPACRPASRARRSRSSASLANELLLILAAIVTMYIVLGVLYESYIHPITILSTLPSAGVGALLALMLAGNDLGVIAIIGIILLIGIVKKNAIMMIDFALDAERERGHGAARGDLPGLPAALPADHDDHDGRAARRAAADARLRAWARSCAIRSASRWSAA